MAVGTSPGASPFCALDDCTFRGIPLGASPGDPLAVVVPSPGVVPRVAETVVGDETPDAGVSAVDSGIVATHSGSASDFHSAGAGTMPGSEPSKFEVTGRKLDFEKVLSDTFSNPPPRFWLNITASQ